MSRNKLIGTYIADKNTGHIGIQEAAQVSNGMKKIKSRLRCLFCCVEFIVW